MNPLRWFIEAFIWRAGWRAFDALFRPRSTPQYSDEYGSPLQVRPLRRYPLKAIRHLPYHPDFDIEEKQ